MPTRRNGPVSSNVRPQEMPPLGAPIPKKLHENGWARLQVTGSPEALFSIAESLGTIVNQGSRPELSRLTPIDAASADPNTASASYGTGRFPYHTDLAHWPKPPRFLVMGNADTTSSVPTLLLDSRIPEIYDRISCLAERALWRVTKTQHPFVCSTFLTGSKVNGIRWDLNVMSPLNDAARMTVSDLTSVLECGRPHREVSFDWHIPGTVLIIDNWRMLHARPNVPQSESARALYRVFISES